MLDQSLKEFVSYIESLDTRYLALLNKHYDLDARYKGAFDDVQGLRALRAVFERYFTLTQGFKVKVIYGALSPDSPIALIRWDLLFNGKKGRISLSGCSELTFNEKGKIVSHIDYWDPFDARDLSFPVVSALVHHVRKKLSSS